MEKPGPSFTFVIPRWKTVALFFVAFLVVFVIGSRNLGSRPLWQDEVETAERARSALATGLPRVTDPNGNWSLNAGGREIEETDLHRYTPWLQFYAGAAGLAVQKPFGLDADTAVRLPFVFLHAMTSGLIAASLPIFIGAGVVESAIVASLYGLGTVRLLHARSARYHALTDFLFLSAWMLYGIFRRRKSTPALIGLSICIGLLLHTHTLFGFLSFGIFSGMVFLEGPRERRTYGFIALNLVFVASLFLLTRPWLQSEIWGSLAWLPRRSFRSWFEIGYAFWFFSASFLWIAGNRLLDRESRPIQRDLALATAFLALVYVGGAILDLHPFSQVRYYLPLNTALFFWPIWLGSKNFWLVNSNRRVYLAALAIILVSAETTRHLSFFHGVRSSLAANRDEQPLRKALSIIQREARAGEGVLIEYVPQYVNWYLSGLKPALIPDESALSKLGKKNPDIHSQPLVEPTWHIYYARVYDGFWSCERNCDLKIDFDISDPSHYTIRSTRLNRSYRFCVLHTWMTDQWKNAPFTLYRKNPVEDKLLVLAKRCDRD